MYVCFFVSKVSKLAWSFTCAVPFIQCMYSHNQKTSKYEDDFIAIRKCIWCCYRENNFTRHLLNHKLSEMGLLILTNFLFPWRISVSRAHWAIQSLNLSLKVIFLFQSFLVAAASSPNSRNSLSVFPSCAKFSIEKVTKKYIFRRKEKRRKINERNENWFEIMVFNFFSP